MHCSTYLFICPRWSTKRLQTEYTLEQAYLQRGIERPLSGQRIVELFKQIQYNPIPVELQVAVMWAMQNGFVDPVPVDRVKEFQNKLQDFLETRKEPLLASIRQKKQLDAELEANLKATLEEFSATKPVG